MPLVLVQWRIFTEDRQGACRRVLVRLEPFRQAASLLEESHREEFRLATSRPAWYLRARSRPGAFRRGGCRPALYPLAGFRLPECYQVQSLV